MTDNSELIVNAEGKITTYAGPDAIELFRIKAIKVGLEFFARTGMKPNRAYTLTAMLSAATSTTKKRYPKSKDGALRAAADLAEWIAAMHAALPVKGPTPK